MASPPATLQRLDEKAVAVARLLVQQPEPARERLIVALEQSEQPAPRGDLDRLIAAQARALLAQETPAV